MILNKNLELLESTNKAGIILRPSSPELKNVFNEIKTIFAKNNINIAAQYLQTDDSIGYVVIDVEAEDSELALRELKLIEGTLKARLLHSLSSS